MENKAFVEKTLDLFFMNGKQEICREYSRSVFYDKENKRFEKRVIDS